MISLIGYVSRTGEARFIFGSLYLYDGLSLLPVALGMFAMPVMVETIIEGSSLAKVPPDIKGLKGVFGAIKDLWRSRMIWLRGTIIGYIIGILPGIGSQAASWVSYAQGKMASKEKADWGKGSPDALVAATCATNGSHGGDLLCTLALGIPGSASMAILLGAMLMVGLIPGPGMLTEHLTLSLGLMYVIPIANVIGVLICLFFIPQLARVATLPARIVVALVVPLILVGVYAPDEEIMDTFTLAIATVFGFAMKEYGYSRPALFLGFVLGTLFEQYLSIALQVGGPAFWATRPICLVLIISCIGIVTYRPIKNLFAKLGQRSKVKESGVL